MRYHWQAHIPRTLGPTQAPTFSEADIAASANLNAIMIVFVAVVVDRTQAVAVMPVVDVGKLLKGLRRLSNRDKLEHSLRTA